VQVVVSPDLLQQTHIKVAEAHKSGDPRFRVSPKYPAQAVTAVLTSFVAENALPKQGIAQLAELLSARFGLEFPEEVIDPDKLVTQARAFAALAIASQGYAMPKSPILLKTGHAAWLLVPQKALDSPDNRKSILRYLQSGYRLFYFDPSANYQAYARVEDPTLNR
jgi:hypothetical protein